MKKKKRNNIAEMDIVEAKVLGKYKPEKAIKKQNKIFGVEKDEIFTPKTLWKVINCQGVELVYTGFDVAQMMSLSAKEKILCGCKEVEDKEYKFLFVKSVLKGE